MYTFIITFDELMLELIHNYKMEKYDDFSKFSLSERSHQNRYRVLNSNFCLIFFVLVCRFFKLLIQHLVIGAFFEAGNNITIYFAFCLTPSHTGPDTHPLVRLNIFNFFCLHVIDNFNKTDILSDYF